MQFSVDPKPIGAFIEYTLKPLIDYSRELLESMEAQNLNAGELIRYAFKLYIIDCVIRVVVNLASVGMICLTVYYCLHIAK